MIAEKSHTVLLSPRWEQSLHAHASTYDDVQMVSTGKSVTCADQAV